MFTAGRACGFCGSILAPTNYHNFESSLGIAKKEPEGGVESRLFNRGPKKTRGHAVVASVTGLQGLNSRAKRTWLINAMGITTSHSAHEVLLIYFTVTVTDSLFSDLSPPKRPKTNVALLPFAIRIRTRSYFAL